MLLESLYIASKQFFLVYEPFYFVFIEWLLNNFEFKAIIKAK